MNFKKDFPVFENNQDLVFLDSWASSQKPKYVIDWVSEFISNDYANIHRWYYALSERSEEAYHNSKKIVAEFLHCSATEIFYTYNSTYGINLIAWSLGISWYFSKWDNILVWIWEHHANVVPRQIIAKQYWVEIRFIAMDIKYEIDWKDFDSKYDENTKVVAIGHVSNVTGQIYDLKQIKNKLRDDTFFLVDASQSIPHFALDVQDIWCDCLVFTWHKVFAYTGIGTVYLKKNWIKKLDCIFSWWWAIKSVSETEFTFPNNIDKFEMWTPNIIWAVSLLKAFEYIRNIWWYEVIQKHEEELINYTLEKFNNLKNKIDLIWPVRQVWYWSSKNRIWVFSFVIKDWKNVNQIWEIFAKSNVAVRCGWHCAHPLHKKLWRTWTCRISLHIYNDKNDVDKFFEVLSEIVYSLLKK